METEVWIRTEWMTKDGLRRFPGGRRGRGTQFFLSNQPLAADDVAH